MLKLYKPKKEQEEITVNSESQKDRLEGYREQEEILVSNKSQKRQDE